MSTSLLGIAREADEYYVLNITDGYKAKLVNWFSELETRITATLKAGNSVALIGPHGAGKSVLARYIAARFVGEYYAVLDLGVDVITFDSLLEMLHEVPNALGFYDPLGISFYDNPLVPRGELGAQWARKCKYVIGRAMYLNTSDIPTLLVLPRDLFSFSPCKELVERNMKILDISEYLNRINLRQVLEEVFSSHASALGCRKSAPSQFVEYVLERHKDASGVFALAAHGGRLYARRRCAPYKAEELYKETLKGLSKIYYDLYRELFFPTCQEAKAVSTPLTLSLEGQHLPIDIAYPLAQVEYIARRLSILSKLTTDTGVREEVLEELRELYRPREEVAYAVRWAVSPKESIVKEALGLTLAENPCLTQADSSAQRLRIVYKGLLAIRPELALELAKAMASIALGEYDFCAQPIGQYLCYGGAPSRAVIEALGVAPKRITLEFPTPQLIRCEDASGRELLTQLALIDARRAPAACLEKFAEILYSQALRRQDALELFYLLYRDYIEVAAERGTPYAVRKVAVAHFLNAPPRDSLSVLSRIISTALEFGDYKSVEAAVAAMASADPDAAAKAVPSCDCPYLKISSLYHVARKMAEKGRHQEALKLLDLAIAELRRSDLRYEYTPQFIKSVEELYRQAAWEVIL